MPVTNNEPIVNTEEEVLQESTNTEAAVPVETPVVEEEQPVVQESAPQSKVNGLSAAEMNDPNSIHVTVSDPNAPLVILFGPPACGKTMSLVRLTRFLKSEGYTISPVRTFRPAADINYKEICDNFDQMINSNDAARTTDRISFMLVEVIKNGRRLCQILEAPGEYYFNPDDPNAGFPSYVNTLMASQNRKIWTVMVEPNWMNETDRRNYVTRIANLKQNMRPSDTVVFVYNKIDLTNFVRSVGNVNVSQAIKQVKYDYVGIFEPFRNQNPITRFWREYNCDFVPFQTGFYTKSINGLNYQEGPREYCVKLWKTIMSKIRG